MKDDIKDIKAFAAIFQVVLTLFFAAAVYMGANSFLCIGMYGVFSILVCFSSICLVSRRVNQTMVKVDDTIQALIDHTSVEHFSTREDTLLGKFQMQILKLHDMMAALEERERKQRVQLGELIGDLVHQMNTPITNIQMYSDFLQDKDLEQDTAKRFLFRIEEQVERLEWLGEGFSKASRLEAGVMRMQPKLQPLLPVLLRGIDQAAPKAKKRDMELCFQGNQELMAYYDSKWMEEAVVNLLENGVKYGNPGSRVVVSVVSYELYIRIDVKSSGTPIEKEEYPKLFKRFYRGKDAHLIPGVGLGLYLVRKIVTAQGGYVKAGADGTKGNVFSVFLKKDDGAGGERYGENGECDR